MLTWLISKYFLCLVEEFDSKFSIKILEKAFYALRASFLWEHKKYQKEGKLPNEVRNSTKACCSRKTSQRPVKNSIYIWGHRQNLLQKNCSIFLLRVDEKCCLWHMSISVYFSFLFLYSKEKNWKKNKTFLYKICCISNINAAK